MILFIIFASPFSPTLFASSWTSRRAEFDCCCAVSLSPLLAPLAAPRRHAAAINQRRRSSTPLHAHNTFTRSQPHRHIHPHTTVHTRTPLPAPSSTAAASARRDGERSRRSVAVHPPRRARRCSRPLPPHSFAAARPPPTHMSPPDSGGDGAADGAALHSGQCAQQRHAAGLARRLAFLRSQRRRRQSSCQHHATTALPLTFDGSHTDPTAPPSVPTDTIAGDMRALTPSQSGAPEGASHKEADGVGAGEPAAPSTPTPASVPAAAAAVPPPQDGHSAAAESQSQQAQRDVGPPHSASAPPVLEVPDYTVDSLGSATKTETAAPARPPPGRPPAAPSAWTGAALIHRLSFFLSTQLLPR